MSNETWRTGGYVDLSTPRTQAQRRQGTRAALISAGRELFARDGYESVSSEQLVAAAGVTRGALYHHFDGKKGLFAAVFEQIEEELVGRFDLGELDGAEPLDVLIGAADQFLSISLEADVQRIALLDGPSVLGWEAWYEVEARHGLGLIEAGLSGAMEAGQIRRLPVAELSLMLLGALMEGALSLARADEPEAARERTGQALRALLEGLRV